MGMDYNDGNLLNKFCFSLPYLTMREIMSDCWCNWWGQLHI